MLSIVLPTFNESRCNCLQQILKNLAQLPDAEILVIDGGSTDGTLQTIEQFGIKPLTMPDSSRAERLNRGLSAARGEMILLHHPRSVVHWQSLAELEGFVATQVPCWGGLSHQFDSEHPVLRFTSWYSNHVRGDLRGIFYLDHCIFLHRQFVDQGVRVPAVEIFEDTGLSLSLRELSQPVRLPLISRTSAIRFRENGVFRQALLNQLIKIAYLLRVSPKTINKLYEKGLNLNQLKN